jgi:hypothetical protein
VFVNRALDDESLSKIDGLVRAIIGQKFIDHGMNLTIKLTLSLPAVKTQCLSQCQALLEVPTL